MKVPIFLFLALCISHASAFGLYGCYERIMFWQAYQMDADSDTKKIAKSCASDSATQGAKLGSLSGGRCNFRQFLYYISSDEKERNLIKGLPADIGDETNIDKLADNLYKKDIGTGYRPNVIYQGVDRSDIPQLFKAISEFVGTKANDDNKKLVSNAQFARNRVQEGRTAVRNRDVGYLLRWDYDKEHQPSHNGVKFDPRDKNQNSRGLEMVTEGLVPEIENRGRGWETVDLEAAKNNILADPKYKGQSLKVQKYINEVDEIAKEGKADGDKKGHAANIEAIRKGRRGMSTGSCERK